MSGSPARLFDSTMEWSMKCAAPAALPAPVAGSAERSVLASTVGGCSTAASTSVPAGGALSARRVSTLTATTNATAATIDNVQRLRWWIQLDNPPDTLVGLATGFVVLMWTSGSVGGRGACRRFTAAVSDLQSAPQLSDLGVERTIGQTR